MAPAGRGRHDGGTIDFAVSENSAKGPGCRTLKGEARRQCGQGEKVVTRWVNDGFCRVDEILILSPHGTKGKTSLADRSKTGEWPLVSVANKKPGELTLVSINKAKGLDALAVIRIDLQSFDKLSTAQEQMDNFMGASRARQLLAIFQRKS